MQDAPCQTAPLGRVLQQLATELAQADHQVEALEVLLRAHVRRDALTTAEMAELQGLDHMRQTLAGLAVFVENLAQSTDPTLTTNAAAAAAPLTLSALQARLAAPHRLAEKSEDSGSLHLF